MAVQTTNIDVQGLAYDLGSSNDLIYTIAANIVVQSEAGTAISDQSRAAYRIVLNNGDIAGNVAAVILANSHDRLTNTKNGFIFSANNAILLQNNNQILTNSGDIEANNVGIAVSAAATIYNYGSIEASTGITFNSGTAVTLVKNTGVIDATSGLAIQSPTSGAMTVRNSGRIDGDIDATDAVGDTIVNSGSINGIVDLAGNGTNIILNSGQLVGRQDTAAVVGYGLRVSNTGNIAAGPSTDPTGDAITFLGGTNTLYLATGTIEGEIGVSGTLNLQEASNGSAFVNVIHDAGNGAGSIVHTSDGTLTLSGANAYSGSTDIQAGSIALDHATEGAIDAAGTGYISMDGESVLQVDVSGQLINQIECNAGDATIAAVAGTIVDLTGEFDDAGASSITFGAASATGTIVFSASTVYTQNAASFIEIAGGSLLVGSATFGSLLAPPASANVTLEIDAGATLNTGSSSETIEDLIGLGTLTNYGSKAAGGGHTIIEGGAFDGIITGSGSYEFSSNSSTSGNTELFQAATYSGATTVDAGATLSLVAAASLSAQSAITDNGTIVLSGTSLGGSTLTETSAGGLVSGNGSISANVLSALNFSSSGGALTFTGADVFAGTLAGTDMIFAGGTDAFAAGSSITASIFDIAGAAVTFQSGLTYQGTFNLESGSLNLATVTASLDGATDLGGGTIAGSGNLGTYGSTTLHGATKVSGAVTLLDGGVLTATANLTLQTSADLTVTASGIYNLDGNFYIANQTSSDVIVNQGLIEKTVGTSSAISGGITNSGTIEAASGTLKLTGAISGTGTLDIAGTSVMELGGIIAAGQTAAFGTGSSAGNGTLKLDAPTTFQGTITGFASGDSISLTGFDTASHLTYTAAASGGGTLSITDNGATFSAHLAGNYTSSSFSLAHSSSGEIVHVKA